MTIVYSIILKGFCISDNVHVVFNDQNKNTDFSEFIKETGCDIATNIYDTTTSIFFNHSSEEYISAYIQIDK